jgi:hypothetical protein
MESEQVSNLFNSQKSSSQSIPRPASSAFAVCAALLFTLAAQVQSLLGPADLPLSPFDVAPSESTHAEKELQRMQLDLTLVTTNEAELLLVREIRGLTEKLGELEKEAYSNDPLLRTYGQYLDKPKWVQNRHSAVDRTVISGYYAGDPDQKEQRQQTENTLSGLCQLLVIKELGANTNFAPLLKSAFEGMEAMVSSNAQFRSRGSLYWQYDRLIGYQSPTRPVRLTRFEDYLAEIDKRYQLLMDKVVAIQHDRVVPPEVLDYIKYGDTYRMLDGCAEFYVEVRTPEVLRKTREQLNQKYHELYWARQPTRPPASAP